MILFMNIDYATNKISAQLFPLHVDTPRSMFDAADRFHGSIGSSYIVGMFDQRYDGQLPMYAISFDDDTDVWLCSQDGWQSELKDYINLIIYRQNSDADVAESVWDNVVAQINDIFRSGRTDKVAIKMDANTFISPCAPNMVSDKSQYQPDQIKPELMSKRIKDW